MKSKFGISKNVDFAKAVTEALGGVSNPVGLVYICPYEMIESVGNELTSRFPGVPVLGTGGISYFNDTIDDKHLQIMTVTGGAKMAAGVIKHIKKAPLSEIYTLEKSVQEVGAGTDNTICLEFCPYNEEVATSTLNVVLDKHKISLIGGSIFDVPDGKDPILYVNGKIYKDTLGYMMIKNTEGKVHMFKENIYAPSDNPVHIATKVDLNKRELCCLDGRPAAQVYSEETGVPVNKVCDNVFVNPFGRVVGDEVYIASMKEPGTNGGLINYKKIYENDAISILNALDYREVVEETKRNIRSKVSNPSCMISFNCCLRYLFFNSENYTTEYLKNMATVAPNFGYIAGGEQYLNQHVNQTMVCAVFD